MKIHHFKTTTFKMNPKEPYSPTMTTISIWTTRKDIILADFY